MKKKIIFTFIFAVFIMISSYAQIFSNTYHDQKRIPVLKRNRFVIYNPVESWYYVHHPSITCFNEFYYAIFSNGINGEDDFGQRVMITKSTNKKKWSKPEVLQEPRIGDYELLKVLTPCGIAVVQNKLVVYFT